MAIKNTTRSYGSVAKGFHWIIFLLIACLLAAGFIMEDMAVSPFKFTIYGLHKSFGITVLLLVALRLIWKARNPAPQLPRAMKGWEKLLAHVGHGILYVLMFAMPLSGWAMSSAAGFPVSVFGLFTLPDLVAPDHSLKADLIELHGTLALVIIGMVSLHILAALLHHFYYKNNVLRRMLPFCKEGRDDENASDTMVGC